MECETQVRSWERSGLWLPCSTRVAWATPTIWTGLVFPSPKRTHRPSTRTRSAVGLVDPCRHAGLVQHHGGIRVHGPVTRGHRWAFLENNPGKTESDLVSTNWSLLNFTDPTNALAAGASPPSAIFEGPGVLHLTTKTSTSTSASRPGAAGRRRVRGLAASGPAGSWVVGGPRRAGRFHPSPLSGLTARRNARLSLRFQVLDHLAEGFPAC